MDMDIELYEENHAKDYFLQIKIKNAPLLRMMRLNNISTSAELARATKTSQTSTGNYLNLKTAPLTKAGDWRVDILKIADFFRVTPDLLFPEHHLEKPLARNSLEIAISLREAQKLSEGQAHDDSEIRLLHETEFTLEDILDNLSIKNQKVIKKRYGIGCQQETLEEIAKDSAVTRERIRQIERKALAYIKLRIGLLSPSHRADIMKILF